MFGYEINLFSYNKYLFYAATLCEYQIFLQYQIILKYFDPNIHTIAVVYTIGVYMLSRTPSKPNAQVMVFLKEVPMMHSRVSYNHSYVELSKKVNWEPKYYRVMDNLTDKTLVLSLISKL